MESVKLIKEIFNNLLSLGPTLLIKWILVFVVLIIGYIIIIKFKIYEYLIPDNRLEKKIREAKRNKRIIEARLIESYDEFGYSGKYEYEINGRKHTYIGHFNPGCPRKGTIHLYYKNTPKKVFTDEVYHRFYNIAMIPAIIVVISPFILASYIAILLGIVN